MANQNGGVIPPAEAGHTHTNAIYVAVITVTVLATSAVILRFVARRRSEAPISYDDYTIVLALVFLYGLNIDTIIATALWGLGTHISSLSREQLLHFQKNGLATFALYFTTNAATKISLLLLYYRLFFPCRIFGMAVYTAAVIVITWWVAVSFADIFQCVPIKAFWDFRVKNGWTTKCMDIVTFSIATGVSNLVTDFMVLCLPMPMVWSLKKNRKQKITLTGIFMLGFLVCAMSIIRIVKLVFPRHFDPTYSLASVFIWTSVESSVGIISACLPIMSAIFGRWFSATLISRSRSNRTPSPRKTDFSFQRASASLASPVKARFAPLERPTYRDQIESSYGDDLDTPSSRDASNAWIGPLANVNHDDKEWTNWLTYGMNKGNSRDSRLEEAREMEGGVINAKAVTEKGEQ